MDRHEELFRLYVEELEQARQKAEAWWVELLASEAREGERAGPLSLRLRWPYGAASHPFVILVFRKFFLACDALNKELETELKNREARAVDDQDEAKWGTDEPASDDDEPSPVPMRVFLFEWLSGEHNVLYRFINHLTFVPIGENNGRYT